MGETIGATLYRWRELESDRPMARLSRQRVIGEQAMISRVILEEGCVVPRHQHENEQFACIISGALEFTLGNESHPTVVVARAGDVMHFPSNAPHAARALEETVVLDIFSPPSETTGIDRA